MICSITHFRNQVFGCNYPGTQIYSLTLLRQFRNKKFELMLTRRTKAYSSSCSQTVSLSPVISSQFILEVCSAAEDCKKSIKPLILEVQGFSESSIFMPLKISSLGLVLVQCCDRQHAHAYLQPFSRKTGQQR